ncbi:MAG: TerB family tellurite resistance protein [Rhizobiaceae bacterium]
MIERLLSFLRDVPAPKGGLAGDDPKVAAAAIMVHVMDADGVRRDDEKERLLEALSETFGLDGAALDAVFRAGEEADREAIDLYAFTSVLKRHLDEAARVHFIEVLWQVVYADGELHELEDNTVWRVAELIGVDSRDRVEARIRARAAPGVDH